MKNILIKINIQEEISLFLALSMPIRISYYYLAFMY